MTKKQKQELNSRIKMKVETEEKELFRSERIRRYKVNHKSCSLIVLGLIAVLIFILGLLLPTGFDSNNHHISMPWFVSMVQKNIQNLAGLAGGSGSSYMGLVICRFTVVAFVGAALAISGTVYQGALKNGLASPTTLGVQSGGVLGGTIYVLFFASTQTGVISISEAAEASKEISPLQAYMSSIFIAAGCLIVVGLVITIAKIAGGGKINTVTLILTGMMFSSVLGGVTGLVRYWLMYYQTYDAKTYAIRYMMMGTFNRISSVDQVIMIGIPVLVGIAVMICMSNRLNVLVFSEDEARSMGIRVDLLRKLLLVIVTCLVAVIISFCGMIAFIGFIVPHLARRIVGPDFRYLIPASALLGSSVMMFIYYIGTALNYSENINFMTSIVGGTIFIAMLLFYRRKSHADWA